jgi:hypothetical protein
MFGGYLADQVGGSLVPSLWSAFAVTLLAAGAVVGISDEPRI